MTFHIELPPDIEACYIAEARAKGVPVERHIAERLIQGARTTEHLPAANPAKPLDFPLLRGDVIGSLSRRDIYDEHR